MSNHVARAHPEASPSRRIPAYLWLVLLAVATAVLAPIVHRQWIAIDRSWPAFPGRVLDVRLVKVGPIEGGYYTGGYILYRLEVRAAWMENGVAQDQWLPTTITSGNRESLLLFASQLKDCQVRRNPHHRASLLADVGDEWQPVHPTSPKNGK